MNERIAAEQWLVDMFPGGEPIEADVYGDLWTVHRALKPEPGASTYARRRGLRVMIHNRGAALPGIPSGPKYRMYIRPGAVASIEVHSESLQELLAEVGETLVMLGEMRKEKPL